MKKGIYTIFLLLICFVTAQAQADYKMYLQIMLEPKLDQVSLFEKNLAEHNRKFHSEGFRKASVWTVSSGSNGGKYAWVMGPLTFTDFDGHEADKVHDADWNDNVLALCSEVSDFEWWKLNEEFTYTPEGSETDDEVFRVYDIKKGQLYRFEEVLKKVVAVYKAKNYPDYFEVYYAEFSSNSNRDLAFSSGFKTWASLDEKSTFKADFEEVHGAGSWFTFIEEYRDSYNSYEDELSHREAHLSGD